uniref:Uncharacterized protein n=1 Tax=Acanthochromis polyacanthus TaxID=80966 RepID=A0A3Q1FKS9_9TELE
MPALLVVFKATASCKKKTFIRSLLKESLDEEPDVCDVPIALIIIGDLFSPHNILVVLEGEVVEFFRLPYTFILLFVLIYTFNLHYPEKLSMFTFLQKTVMGHYSGTPLKPHKQSLKNDLLH